MANVYYANQALQSANHAFSAIWKVTRALKKAGWTYIASGNGSSKDTTGVATSDLWGGNADPSADTYPSALDSVAAWWMAQGPTIHKVPVSTNSTGTFQKGEKITQATSGAEGEILGFMYDSVTPANSFLTIQTRTGTFNGTNVITGANSGATITPSATPVAFICEVVFWKSTDTTNGTVYYNRVNTAVDTSLGSLKSATGCTSTVAPGGGGTGNSFPSTAATIRGTGGSASHGLWLHTTTLGSPKFQIAATDIVGTSSYSPDGTFWIVCGCPSVSATACTGFGFFRLDDTEDGDLDPFVWDYQGSTSWSRTANTGTSNADVWSNTSTRYSSSVFYFNGWRKRGFASGDAWQNYSSALLYFAQTGGNVLIDTFATVETVASTTLATPPKVREPVWVATRAVSTKQRKGTVRWAFFTPTGTAYDVWDSKTLFQVQTASSTFVGYMLGPWDGSSTPTQT
jgi:hypothetical protein